MAEAYDVNVILFLSAYLNKNFKTYSSLFSMFCKLVAFAWNFHTNYIFFLFVRTQMYPFLPLLFTVQLSFLMKNLSKETILMFLHGLPICSRFYHLLKCSPLWVEPNCERWHLLIVLLHLFCVWSEIESTHDPLIFSVSQGIVWLSRSTFYFYLLFFWRVRVCWPTPYAYVAHDIFLRDVWIRTQRAAVASRGCTNLATWDLTAHLPPTSHPSP